MGGSYSVGSGESAAPLQGAFHRVSATSPPTCGCGVPGINERLFWQFVDVDKSSRRIHSFRLYGRDPEPTGAKWAVACARAAPRTPVGATQCSKPGTAGSPTGGAPAHVYRCHPL